MHAVVEQDDRAAGLEAVVDGAVGELFSARVTYHIDIILEL